MEFRALAIEHGERGAFPQPQDACDVVSAGSRQSEFRAAGQRTFTKNSVQSHETQP
jgi:hypothetical protein